MSICYVTCCSKNKAPEGDPYEKYQNDFIANPDIIKTRREIRRRILRGEVQGNLRSSLLGQDFGGTEPGFYLPAYERYSPGSFMSSLFRALGDNEDLLNFWLEENALLFVSGLYGLVEANEPIQNYDVRLEDTKNIWKRDMLTRHLRSLIEPAKHTLILDCTASAEYSQMIDWDALSRDFTILHVIGEHFEAGQVRSAAGEMAFSADGKFLQERITRGNIMPYTDADIRFVASSEFDKTRKKLEQGALIGRESIGFIAIDEKEFTSFKKGPGRFLSRFFDFHPITSKDGLINAKNKGCRQCLCRITLPKHKDYQVVFGKVNIQEAIKAAGMEPVTIKNGYTKLRLKFVVE